LLPRACFSLRSARAAARDARCDARRLRALTPSATTAGSASARYHFHYACRFDYFISPADFLSFSPLIAADYFAIFFFSL
jgi:hypothetical protein